MTPPIFVLEPQLRAVLADLAIDTSAVLARAGLPRDLLARGSTKVSVDDYFGLWRAMEAEWGEASLPLELPQAVSPNAFCPTTFAALCAPDLNRAAQRARQYKPLTGPIRYVVTIDEASTVIGCDWSLAGQAPPPSLAHANLIYWVALARLATRAHIAPTAYFGPPTGDNAAFAAYLGMDPAESDQHEVVFRADDATTPFLTASNTMWNYFEPGLRSHLPSFTEGATTTERVRALLIELLPAGSASLDGVGRELGVSSRTLQRRLQAEGMSYHNLLSEVRRDLAIHYLGRSDLSLAQIALLLGFEEPTSFQRAFSGWTGTTPNRFQSARATVSSST